MTIKENIDDLLEEFNIFDDWMDKYNYIIEMGKEAPLMDESLKTKQNLITGCQSQVWLNAKLENGLVHFDADSDAIITKGIVHLLLKVINDMKPEDIMKEDFSFIDNIGLKEHLSPTRSNGLTSMIKQIKLYAVVFDLKNKKDK